VDPQGWWGVLLQGSISAMVGGVVAALTAWGVVAATRRHERRAALRMEARRAAVQMFQMTCELHQALQRVLEDNDAPVPTADGREWLVNATGLEVAMFALDGDLGNQISQDLGNVRRALERLNLDTQSKIEAAETSVERVQRLSDDLADWLMAGRHRLALPNAAG
jgi:hypothetical protein